MWETVCVIKHEELWSGKILSLEMLLHLMFSPLSRQGKEYMWGAVTAVKKAGT